MGRSYDTAFYSELLKEMRKGVPGLAVSTDIIVGFPGEEAEDFLQSYAFIKESAFSRLHVFKYSPRQGTTAAAMSPQVAPKVKEWRSRELIALGEKLADVFQEKFLGQSLSVLFEKELELGAEQGLSAPNREEDGTAGTRYFEGLSSNYLRVRSLTPGDCKGKLEDVFIEKKFPGYLQGILLKK